jgi:hypothetical protein
VRDDERNARQHIVALVRRIDRRRPRPLGEDVDELLRLDAHVGDLGVGNEHRRDRPVQADQLALADRQLHDAAGAGVGHFLGGCLIAGKVGVAGDRNNRDRG